MESKGFAKIFNYKWRLPIGLLVFSWLTFFSCGDSDDSKTIAPSAPSTKDAGNGDNGAASNSDSENDTNAETITIQSASKPQRANDLRARAETRLTFPSPAKVYDPRYTKITGEFSEEGARRSGLMAESLVVPDDGRSFNLQPCDLVATPVKTEEVSAIKIDGSLLE